jgi:hypothetical protein
MGFGYVEDGYWADGYAIEYQVAALPAIATPSAQTVLPAYAYVQWTPDADTDAFFITYNTISQQYLNQINNLNLPVWSQQFGNALDWVATNLYGINRPVLSAVTVYGGTYNSNDYNTIAYDTPQISGNTNLTPVNDDIYQRILTWNLYTGDGKQFTMSWLKNRVVRFLTMQNGISTPLDNTYIVSISFSSARNVTIAVSPTFVAASAANLASAISLQEAINQQVLSLPFQYNFTVTY